MHLNERLAKRRLACGSVTRWSIWPRWGCPTRWTHCSWPTPPRWNSLPAAAPLLLAWLLGAPGSVHIGASGVLFGYLGFLLLSGWYARSAASILLSLGVAAAWGGLVLGVMPGTPGISWQSHLGGFIGGVLAARHFGKRR